MRPGRLENPALRSSLAARQDLWNQIRSVRRAGPAQVLVRIYFNEVLIDENLVLRCEPIPLTTAMIASEMPAAMRPYSIAVAAVSSARNLRMILMPFVMRQKI